MPSPVAQIVLPKPDITAEDHAKYDAEWDTRWDGLPIDSICAELNSRERELLDALTQLSALREASEWVRESSLIEAADIAKSALSPRANMTQIIQAEKCSKEILKKVRRFDE